MKFYIETFGCTANSGNSKDAAYALQEMGHVPSTLEEADAVIVNTCAVTEKTERKMLQRLRLLQGSRLVVAGCLFAALPDSIREISCRGRVGPLNKEAAAKIAELFSSSSCGGAKDLASKSVALSKSVATEPINSKAGQSSPRDLCGIINIAEGCNGGCSYCIVRKARGKLISRRPEDIVHAARNLLGSGIAEIQLAAQDAASYGNDCGLSLPGLLQEICALPGDFKVRVGMMNPNSVLPIQDELLAAFGSPKIYRFLHIPVQSGSNSILKSMGRKYSAGDFIRIIDAFRCTYPDITIITDVIVGFPGETESDFAETMSLMQCLQPDKINITKFSRRPGTAAAELYDMPDRIKKDRSRAITRLCKDIAAHRNLRYKGEIIESLVTECGRDKTMKARAANYLGIVINGTPPLGSFIKIKVVDIKPFFVCGDPVP
jgi:threonylcarbamoyladenosine tRNA methylthiotransferase CDKAL1